MLPLRQRKPTLADGFRLGRLLGYGGFGKVWEAFTPTGEAKAIKFVHSAFGPNRQCRELDGVERMSKIRHPNLLTIEQFEVNGNTLTIVMELAECGLEKRLEECVAESKPGIPRAELLAYMQDAAAGLDLLNLGYGLQHLDIKPSNLFLLRGQVKLADFGLVHPSNARLGPTSLAVSPMYAAPELFDGVIEPSADQYSLAITYVELLTGKRPYDADDVRSLIYQHLRGKPDLARLSSTDRLIVARALDRNPSKRYGSCGEFVRALDEARTYGLESADQGAKPSRFQFSGAPGKSASRDLLRPPTANASASQPSSQPAEPFQRGDTDTRRIRQSALRTTAFSGQSGKLAKADTLSATFLAFVPEEVYALKLRGFIDATGAEILVASPETTVLKLRHRRWMRLMNSPTLEMRIDVCSRDPRSEWKVVDIRITSNRLRGEELHQQGCLCVQDLRAHLIASEKTTMAAQQAMGSRR